MQALRQKLYNKRGASMVLALLFFLVCMTVGGVVLTAATANAGRLTHLRADQQAYFTLSSAVRLVRDDLQGAVYTVQKTVKDGGKSDYAYPDPDSDAGLKSVRLRKQLAAWAKTLYDAGEAHDVTSADISVPFTIQSENGRTVYARAYMHSASNVTPYVIEVYFKLPAKEGDTAAPDKTHYDIRLYIPATITEYRDDNLLLNGNKEIKVSQVTASIAWGAGVISQAEEDAA